MNISIKEVKTMHESTGGADIKVTAVAPPHKTNRKLQLAAFLLLLLFTALATPSAARAAITPVEPASDDRGVYLLSEPGHLLWFRDTVNGGSAKINAKLTKDIDLSEGGSFSHWTPIGQYTSGDRKDNGYAGRFDGGGFTLSGYIVASADAVSVDKDGSLAAGFFGLVGQSAEIRSLTVSADISGSAKFLCAGGIAGYNVGTITSNANSGGEVSASGGSIYNYAGGIAGYNGGTITDNANGGGVSASGGSFNNAGGIAGYNSGTITNNIHSGGEVSVSSGSSSNCAGGIAGLNFGMITNNAHSGGDVSASGGYSNNYAGGIAGGNSGGTITNNAHSGGAVTASGGSYNYAGGIAGYNDLGNISNSCWLAGDLEAVGGGDKGPDAVSSDVVFLDAAEMKKVVTTVLSVERTLSVEIGGSVPALISYPGRAEDMTNYLSVSGDIYVASPEIAGISGSWPCTVYGKKPGVTAVSFDIGLRATDFSDKDNLKPLAKSCVTDPLYFTVTVAQPKRGGSSHGCAAGLGALSMLTLIPLWLRRKR